MPEHIQTSFVEIGAKLNIDPEFNMLNDADGDLEDSEFFAPKKFAV
jgi:hypothetical protein